MSGYAASDAHAPIRAAVRALCEKFPGEYWRKLDRERAYPTEFVAALTKAGSAICKVRIWARVKTG